MLKDAVKTSLGDELSLLLAVGADVPGDVQIVPAGEIPEEPLPLADTSRPGTLISLPSPALWIPTACRGSRPKPAPPC
jgi:hypothetical protein